MKQGEEEFLSSTKQSAQTLRPNIDLAAGSPPPCLSDSQPSWTPRRSGPEKCSDCQAFPAQAPRALRLSLKFVQYSTRQLETAVGRQESEGRKTLPASVS